MNEVQDPGAGGDKDTSKEGNIVSVATIGSGSYPIVSVPQCKVCRSQSRYEIELAVVNGWTYDAAAEAHGDGSISGRNIRAHFDNGHLPVEEAALDKAQVETTVEYHLLIEDGSERLARKIRVAQGVMTQASLRLRREELNPTIADAIEFAKLLDRAEERARRSQAISGATVLKEVMGLAEAQIERQAFDELRKAVAEDPILSQLVKAARPQQEFYFWRDV